MAGRQRTSFGKRERERKRQEKQAAKRARRHHDATPPPEESTDQDQATGQERVEGAEDGSA
ncbi:MAG TPA: hypothetical protein VEM59_00355 [Acidimicrobiia bacterium]|jgi:hypothetical protein|nr:hypothetical protein [Acidimicrobiia bacterium]